MKLFAHLFVSLLFVACTEPVPRILLVSDFPVQTFQLPDPVFPPVHSHTGWGAAYDGGASAPRTESYRYALVDEHGNLSPWSDEVVITHAACGGVYFTAADFVPDEVDAIAMVWNLSGNVGLSYENGVGPEQFTPPLPLRCPITPGVSCDLRRTPYAAPQAGTSTIILSKPPPPVFQQFGVPNLDLEVCYTFVAQQGETRPSPIALSPRITAALAERTYRRFIMPDVVMPPGARSYRLYFRQKGVARWALAGEFPVDMMQPTVWTWNSRAATIPPPNALSTLSSLQQALMARQSREVVLVDIPDTQTTLPIIDRWGPERGVISGLHGMPWKITYTGGGEVALLVQSNYTTWERMTVSGGFRATSNYSGGQAFGHKYKECMFEAGVRTLDTSSRWRGDHTESETVFDDCHFGASEKGKYGAVLAGTQTANIRFRRAHAYGEYYRKPGSAALLIDTSCPVIFEGGLFVDFGARLGYLGEKANVRIDDVWVDQGYSCLFESISYYPAKVQLRGGKENLWTWSMAANGDGTFTARSFNHSFTGTEQQCHNWVNSKARVPWHMKGARDSSFASEGVTVQTNHPTPMKPRETGTTVPVPIP